MPYLKMILGLLALAAIGDMIAVKYNPQSGSTIVWTFTLVKGSFAKSRNIAYKFAEMFCNNPEECKSGIDEFFAVVSDIPQDVVEGFVGFMGRFTNAQKSEWQDGGTVQKNLDAAKKGAVDFTQGTVEVKGNEKKAEVIIKSLRFSRYDENNLCDLKEGIHPDEYDVTVDEIADLTNMPEKLKKTIKRAKNFTGGNILAVNRLQFRTEDGSLVFGRVAVIRRGKVLDMAYSLHSVEYELVPKQQHNGNAEKLEQFSGSLGQGDGNQAKENAFNGISVELREDFLAFFHKQAIEGFVKHCDYVLKTMTHGENVMRALGVENGGAAEEGKNKN